VTTFLSAVYRRKGLREVRGQPGHSETSDLAGSGEPTMFSALAAIAWCLLLWAGDAEELF
jgi:hypothetical protein